MQINGISAFVEKRHIFVETGKPATGGDNRAGHTGYFLYKNAFAFTEHRFALFRKHLGNALTKAAFDVKIGINKLIAKGIGELTSNRTFAGTHIAN